MDIQSLQKELIQAAATLIYLLATAALYQLQKYLKNKHSIELNEATRKELDNIIVDSIAYAEERARLAIKEGDPMNSDIKKTLAIEFALARKAAQKAGRERVESMILAALGYSRGSEENV